MTAAVDGLGHQVLQPLVTAPPYRAYRLADGSGQELRLDLAEKLRYRDGNTSGGYFKTYLVSRVTDETQSVSNSIQYIYNDGLLVEVRYPEHAGGAERVFVYEYDALGNLSSITDPVGARLTSSTLQILWMRMTSWSRGLRSRDSRTQKATPCPTNTITLPGV